MTDQARWSGSIRAQVIGIGMLGGSVAAALRKRGWHVTGEDVDVERLGEALQRGIIDAAGFDAEAEITFVATPVSSIVERADVALAAGGLVTDVGSVKGSVTRAIDHPCFVGGHPMAGSERNGLEGVNEDLFEGATWVLTPGDHTDPEVYMRVHQIVSSLGAAVVTLSAADHDEIVATISHVPHLVSSALMETALDQTRAHETLLRLAAGGFRDMTRIAAGHPGLWADIAIENRDAIVDAIERLTTGLEVLQELIVNQDRDQLEKVLAVAAEGRKNLPLRAGRPSSMSLLRVPIPDHPGALGDVLGLVGTCKVNVEDLQIAHDPKGDRGVLEMAIATEHVDEIGRVLKKNGFRLAVEGL